MVSLDTLRIERREEILRLAERRGAHNLRIFGSVARGEANENSDLDLLVAWERGRSLLDHAGLVQDLQDLLGIKVHVGTEDSLHWYVRDRILREATPGYQKSKQLWKVPRPRRSRFRVGRPYTHSMRF